MKLKIRFIINPKSGVHQKNDLPDLISNNLDLNRFEYDIIQTEYRKHAKSLAKEASEQGYDIVCAVGGDGSVHEVGTALIGTTTALAILPAGSGNGLARHLNIPLNLKQAIVYLNTSATRKMDTVIANEKPFLNVGGYGFDALIAQKFDNYHQRGFWGYSQLIFKEYFKYSNGKYKFTIDNKTREEELLLFTVANASEFGNGFCISPNSKIDDGILELCLLKPFKGWKAPRLIRLFFQKKSHESQYIEIVPFTEATIEIPIPMSHYDGEPFDVRSTINIRVVPKSLLIFVRNE
jgi:YegS/Rv2252/BmrU family lipid kinase